MRVLVVHNSYQIPGGEDAVVGGETELLQQNGVDTVHSVTNDFDFVHCRQIKRGAST